MSLSVFPLQDASVEFGEDVFYKLIDHLFSAGALDATGLKVREADTPNLSVTVEAGEGYVAVTNGGKRLVNLSADSNSGVPGVLNADDWLATFVAADVTKPRIDRVVLTVQDSLVDGGSGFFRARLQVVTGTATTGATLGNLTGAPAEPDDSLTLAYVLVAAAATTIVNAQILDAREIAQAAGGRAAGPPTASGIPGEIRAWSGDSLPALSYGKWVWADGAIYAEADYPEAAANIAPAWKTHNGKASPGAGNFRAPDMRGAQPLGPDSYAGFADPGQGALGRVTRSGHSTIGQALGAEYHTLSVPEIPAHSHPIGWSNADAAGANPTYPAHGGDNYQGTICNTDSAGGGGAHNNLGPTNVVPFIVRLDG